MFRFVHPVCAFTLALITIVGAVANAEEKTAFPTSKTAIDIKKVVKPEANAELPVFAYIAPDIGTFALRGSKGHATYLWHHGVEELDMHDHDLVYLGESECRRFWIYKIDKHDEYVVFAKEANAGNQNLIFYVTHGETHLWTWKASRFDLHVHD